MKKKKSNSFYLTLSVVVLQLHKLFLFRQHEYDLKTCALNFILEESCKLCYTNYVAAFLSAPFLPSCDAI